MAIHFEELWEKCEQLHHNDGNSMPAIDELIMKLNLYKAIVMQTEIPKEEFEQMKSRTMGEILLVITKISLVDNINVFEALSIAQQHRSSQVSNSIPIELKFPKL